MPEALPEGGLRSDVSLDGVRLRIEYTALRGYLITGPFRMVLARCKSLHFAEILLDVLAMSHSQDFRRAIRIARQQDRSIKPLYSIRGMEWMTVKHRFDAVVTRTLTKLAAS